MRVVGFRAGGLLVAVVLGVVGVGCSSEDGNALPALSAAGPRSERLAVGDSHACLILAGGDVSCWGSNEFKQLGPQVSEDVGDDESPADVGVVPLPGSHHAVQMVTPEGKPYRTLAELRRFDSFDAAVAAERECKAAGCELVGDNPQLSCVPLAPVQRLRSVFHSDSIILGLGRSARHAVQIYELPPAVQGW